MRRPLNLASRPLRNERLPTLVLSVGCVILLGVSAYHVLVARDLLPAKTSSLDGELVALEAELQRLRAESASMGTRQTSPDTLKEWTLVRGLVDRRAFSWSGFLGCLEDVVPADVRLLSIAPHNVDGRIELEVRAIARTVDYGFEFFKALQEREEFQEPFLEGLGESPEGITVDYTMRYVPARSAPRASPEVAAGEGTPGPEVAAEGPAATTPDEMATPETAGGEPPGSDATAAPDPDPEATRTEEDAPPAASGGAR